MRIIFNAIFFAFAFIIIGVSLYYKPTITGYVPAKTYTQNLSLVINKSQNFLLTSDNLEPFTIESFKISGNISGNGQVKIYIDSGKGQRILVYKNIVKKKDKSGLSAITGQVVGPTESNNVNKNDKWLIIKPINILLEKEAFDDINADDYLESGAFNQQCSETCFIKMDMSRNIAYRLIFLVEKGVVLRINEIVYRTEE